MMNMMMINMVPAPRHLAMINVDEFRTKWLRGWKIENNIVTWQLLWYALCMEHVSVSRESLDVFSGHIIKSESFFKFPTLCSQRGHFKYSNAWNTCCKLCYILLKPSISQANLSFQHVLKSHQHVPNWKTFII
jgi:hypothetical protein